jgi:GTP cyclohydrolase I (EC 3.5.4.16)
VVDVQNRKDDRNIDIKKVGVKGIKYPLTVLDMTNEKQYVSGTVNMYVNLPRHFKGTHMSRFVEVLNDYRGQINIRTFR